MKDMKLEVKIVIGLLAGILLAVIVVAVRVRDTGLDDAQRAAALYDITRNVEKDRDFMAKAPPEEKDSQATLLRLNAAFDAVDKKAWAATKRVTRD